MKISLVALKNEIEIINYIIDNNILNDKQIILLNKWFKNIKKNEHLIFNYFDLIEDDLNNTIINDNLYIEDLEYILQKIRHICCLKINICNIIYK